MPRVEVLYFDGCPGHERVLPKVRGIAERFGAEVAVRRVETVEDAEASRFLGSPTVRVDGVDVEPGAEARTDYGLKCRLFRTPAGFRGEPDETWLADALAGGAREALGGVLGGADRWSANRLAGLRVEERRVYESILRAFSDGRDPDVAGEDEALRTLVARDLVQLDDAGGVGVAYPFSARPTRHRVRLSDGRVLHAMCAVDALGIPFLAHEAADIEAREPGSGQAVTVHLDPADGAPRWDPAGTVVVAASTGVGCSDECACPHINFFTSARAAQAYLDQPGLTGTVMSVGEATAAARRLFGGLLDRLAELEAS